MTGPPRQQPPAVAADMRLLADIRHGRSEAFDAFFDRHGPQLWRVARHLAGNDAEAEEIATRALRLAVDPTTPAPRGEHLPPWLCGLVVVSAYHVLRGGRAERRDRRAGRLREEPLDAGLDFDAADAQRAASDDWSEWIADAGRREQLRGALLEAATRLPEGLRSAWLLADVEGLSLHDAGEALDLSPSGVRARVHRARLLLRRDMGRLLAERAVRSGTGSAFPGSPGGRP